MCRYSASRTTVSAHSVWQQRFESPCVSQEDKNMQQFPGEELGYAWGKRHGCDVPSELGSRSEQAKWLW